MKRIFFALTAVACFGASATGAQAQYQQPYQQPYQQQQQQYGRPAPQPQAARAGGYQAARPAYGTGYGVQQTAMRPSTNTYAATPTSAYALKPVNPPSPATQRILMASRTQPTAAPPQVGPATPAPSNVRLPASPAQANWGAPPSGGYDSGAMPYGGGQMGAAPVSAQPDPGMSGNGPIAGGAVGGGCENGQCGGDSCGTSGCCLFGCCGGFCSSCCDSCCIRTTGDLVQHTPFFGTTHGYYYFRPYHVMHVFSQQELATRWGADPRNPYDNTIFQRTYESMGVDLATIKAREEAAAKAKAAGLVDPANEVPVYNIPYQGGPNNSMPTPLPGGYQGVVPYGSQGQFAPQGAPQGNYYPPQGQGYPATGYQGGMIPQGATPNVPGPSIEYVPNR